MALQSIDIAAAAAEIVSAYRPVRIAQVGGYSAAVYICQGRLPWHRRAETDELYVVIEGVITLDTGHGKVVLSESELAVVPRGVGQRNHSGMRSTVFMFHPPQPLTGGNGHLTLPVLDDVEQTLRKVNVAAHCRSCPLFRWDCVATAGDYGAYVARVQGGGGHLPAEHADQLVLVVSGILSLDAADTGSVDVVGGEMVVVPAGQEYRLQSKRGASVLLLAQRGDGLPEAELDA
jgi:mannose-6-phosphate isomerase-like protein (cupin superfamily)